MIWIENYKKTGIKVRLPGNFSGKTRPTTLYYVAERDGFSFRTSDGTNKKVICGNHAIRAVILFDVMIVKAKAYNHSMDNILYNNRPLACSEFPNMGIELTAEEFEKERTLLHDLSSGVLITDPLRNKDFELFIDLFDTKGL